MGADTVVIIVNMALAATAAGVQFRAASRGLPELRAWHAASGVLAVIYVGAYGVLLAVMHDDRGSWSLWVRPLALLAWPIVWIAPAVISVSLLRRLHRVVDGAAT